MTVAEITDVVNQAKSEILRLRQENHDLRLVIEGLREVIESLVTGQGKDVTKWVRK